MVLTLDHKPIVVPDAVRRKAGLRRGDQVEFRVSGHAITIVPREVDDHTPAQRRAVNRGIKKSEEEFRAGLGAGPFDSHEKFIEALHGDAPKAKKTKRR